MLNISFGGPKNTPKEVKTTEHKVNQHKVEVAANPLYDSPGADIENLRSLKPSDLFDEMDMGTHILFRIGSDSIALRNKEDNLTKYYQHTGSKWVNRFRVDEEL